MYLKRGQLYVPDYNQILSVLCPAPFLKIQAASSNRFLYPLPTSGPVVMQSDEDLPKAVVIRHAEFIRRRTFFFDEYLDVWECMEDGR